MAAELPFTTFAGRIKQMETTFQFPLMQQLYEACFSEFADIDKQFAQLKLEGICSLVSAAGTQVNYGYRPRRFAGGPGLPRGRYFTLCSGDGFDDRGTLRDEITAYYSGSSAMTAKIFDPKVELYLVEQLKASKVMTDADLAYPFYLIQYRIQQRDPKTSGIIDANGFKIGEPVNITYGVRESKAQIAHVIDLRYPETQAWFLQQFVELEIENEKKAAAETGLHFLPPKEPMSSFKELLPVIVSLETGGGMIFNQAVGQWLRGHGANALIFPSARANAFNRVMNGKPVDWSGWNLVVYAEAEPPVPDLLFGRMASWRDPDHDHIWVDYTEEGPERGSFSIRGLREFNLLDFDLKKQIACGIRQDNVIAEVTGTRNAHLSHEVNLILEKERDAGTLWYQELDYVDFLTWLEKQWRP